MGQRTGVSLDKLVEARRVVERRSPWGCFFGRCRVDVRDKGLVLSAAILSATLVSPHRQRVRRMHDFIGAKGVIAKERLAELSERRNGPAFLYLASHWGAIALNGAAMHYAWGTWWCVPLFLLQGLLINFLYAPEHECDHFTAFKTRWLNEAVAFVCGFIIFNANSDHRWSHYTHHRNTQNWDRDTELGRGPIRTTRGYLLYLSGMTLIRHKVPRIFLHALGRADDWYLTAGQRRSVIACARWMVAGYAVVLVSAVAAQSWWPLYYWIGPFVLMRWTYVLQGGGEHFGLTHEPNTLLNTRTLTTNAFMRWLNWNMTYHTAHHTFPGVPFHRLPELHREIEERLGDRLPSAPYFRLHWGHIRRFARGETELDICAGHDEQLVDEGKLPAPAGG